MHPSRRGNHSSGSILRCTISTRMKHNGDTQYYGKTHKLDNPSELIIIIITHSKIKWIMLTLVAYFSHDNNYHHSYSIAEAVEVKDEANAIKLIASSAIVSACGFVLSYA